MKKEANLEPAGNVGSMAEKSKEDQIPEETQDALLLKLRTLERRRGRLSEKDVNAAKKTDSKLKEVDNLIGGYIQESNKEVDLKSSVTEELASLDKGIKETIELIGGEESTEKAKNRGMIRMIRYGRKRKEVNKLIAEVNSQIENLRESQKGRAADPSVAQDISRLEEAKILLSEFLENKVARENPQAFVTHWTMKLREWRREYDKTRLITTPNVENVYGAIREKARRALDDGNKAGVFTLLGGTGTGKTVAARRIAREMSGDHNYEFIQANPRMVPEELISRFGLTVHEVDPGKVPEMIRVAQENFVSSHPEINEEDKEFAMETIEQVVKDAAAQKQLETETIMEPVARAAQEGRIVVIDEFNYLSPETLASLNALLDVKPGDESFSIDGKGERFLVKRGFGVIFTGNVGKNFIGRNKLDLAAINRILTNVYEYQYPAQEINKPLAESISDHFGGKEYPRDLFDSAVTLLADEKGNVSVPPGGMEKVWNMTRAFSIIQRLAAGEDFRSLGIDPQGEFSQVASKFKFESVALSFRQLNSIIESWRSDGFNQTLDYYLYDMIIRPAYAMAAPKEAAQMFFVFKTWGGLFQGEPWDSIDIDPDRWSISNLKIIKKEQVSSHQKAVPQELSEIAQEISGQKIPAHQPFGENSEGIPKISEDTERALEEVEMFFSKSKEDMESLSAMAEIMCGEK